MKKSINFIKYLTVLYILNESFLKVCKNNISGSLNLISYQMKNIFRRSQYFQHKFSNLKEQHKTGLSEKKYNKSIAKFINIMNFKA